MEGSSPRLKAFTVTAGLSFWFFIIVSSLGYFSIEILLIFVIPILITTQIFSRKISKGLDIFALVNTKILLTVFFALVISVYGILFKFLRIDLLRLKKSSNSYWLDMERVKSNRIWKQY